MVAIQGAGEGREEKQNKQVANYIKTHGIQTTNSPLMLTFFGLLDYHLEQITALSDPSQCIIRNGTLPVSACLRTRLSYYSSTSSKVQGFSTQRKPQAPIRNYVSLE